MSRLTQSRIGSETATEWIGFGEVRARVVARVPPMREPRREILGASSLMRVLRMCLNATAVSWMGTGKLWVGVERRYFKVTTVDFGKRVSRIVGVCVPLGLPFLVSLDTEAPGGRYIKMPLFLDGALEEGSNLDNDQCSRFPLYC